MTRTSLVTVLIAGALVSQLSGQSNTQTLDGFIARTSAERMPYRVFVPKSYDRAKQYPLIVWLHGGGGLGSDNLQQIAGDQIPGTHLWTSAENQANHPAFVVAPQSIRGWVAEIDGPGLQPEVIKVVAILDALGAEFSIDKRRVYLLGQSMGAGAAWNLVTNQPQRFAAVLMCCPANWRTIERAPAAASVPFWVFAGALEVGSPTSSVIDALKQAGGHPKFTVYPDAGHDIWDRVFAEPGIVEWLFAQSR